MKLHLPTPSPSLSARSVSLAAGSSTPTTTTPLSSVEEEEDEADLASLFGEPDSFDQDGAANRSATTTPPPMEEDDFASLFGEDETPAQDNLAGSNTSTEARPETELTLAITPAAPRMTLHLPLARPGMIAQEEIAADSRSSKETVAEERMDVETAGALLMAAGELTPIRKKRGRPPGSGVKVKKGPVWYRCRYGCSPKPDKDGIHHGMKGEPALRKHMQRVHGVFSNQHETVLVHHCGRRYSPTAAVGCNDHEVTCKTLKEGTVEWWRHQVQAPCTEQEAAHCFAYASGVQPSEMVIVLPHHVEEEQRKILEAAYIESVARAEAAAEAAAATEAAIAAEAGSSQDQAIAIDDDEEEEDAEFELEEYEQGPPAKRRRM